MLRRLIIPVLCLVLAACTVPDVDDQITSTDPTAKPQIVGARGPLSTRQSQALLAKVGGGDEYILQRHLAIEQAVAETPLVAGNRTHLLQDGTETFRAMFAAIRSAKRHVNLEYFIFEEVASDGVNLTDLLAAKRREGVQVNVIYDSFGSSATPSAFLDGLKQAGVKLVEFNPINPLDSLGRSYSLNDRDHRKILVVDGTLAIVGGVNLSTTYMGSLPGKSAGPDGKPASPWRDLDLQIEGPVVPQLQQLFLDHWTEQEGPPLDIADFFPKTEPRGDEVVRIIGSTPDHLVPRYYVTVLSAIRNAEKKIRLTAAYFVPTHQMMEDLLDAARRGVDVQILVPDDSDSDLAIAVQHSRYEDLLEAGVKIFETHDEVLHSKTITIDGVWSVIGSSNFDHRSVIFNDEVDAVVVGAKTAQELEATFAQGLAKATAIDPGTWADRPLTDRLHELVARVWERML